MEHPVERCASHVGVVRSGPLLPGKSEHSDHASSRRDSFPCSSITLKGNARDRIPGGVEAATIFSRQSGPSCRRSSRRKRIPRGPPRYTDSSCRARPVAAPARRASAARAAASSLKVVPRAVVRVAVVDEQFPVLERLGQDCLEPLRQERARVQIGHADRDSRCPRR